MIFSAEFWRTALEHALVAAAAAFTATLVNTTTPTWKDLAAAGVAAGVGALYALIKQLGGVQATAGILKVYGAKHAKGRTTP